MACDDVDGGVSGCMGAVVGPVYECPQRRLEDGIMSDSTKARIFDVALSYHADGQASTDIRHGDARIIEILRDPALLSIADDELKAVSRERLKFLRQVGGASKFIEP